MNTVDAIDVSRVPPLPPAARLCSGCSLCERLSGLDDRELAFASLERAYQERSNVLQWMKVHPFFDPLRDGDRFTDLPHGVGLDRHFKNHRRLACEAVKARQQICITAAMSGCYVSPPGKFK